MSKSLIFNPGSHSLKFELIETVPGQRFASQGVKLASAMIEGIGKGAKLQVFRRHEVIHEEPCEADDMPRGARRALTWLRAQQVGARPLLEHVDFVAVRVVHGGSLYTAPARVDDSVRRSIESLEEFAPLHNKSALDILNVLSAEMADTPAMVTFDTAFHATIPEVAWRYPVERDTADRLRIRKYGFHGLSHRYMLEEYARSVGKRVGDITVVTLHLESGCSAAAIRQGRSVDTTMGMTPLDGLMMGSRSGSIDPAIGPYLMMKLQLSGDEALDLLNKRSGLIGIAGGSLDTRVLKKRSDDAAKLALAMFSYRVRMAVGAYLAVLEDAEAVLFGGGIGEDSPWLRSAVCEGLKGWGLELDVGLNERSTEGQVRITRDGSRLHAYAMSVDEALQMAHECTLAIEHS